MKHIVVDCSVMLAVHDSLRMNRSSARDDYVSRLNFIVVSVTHYRSMHSASNWTSKGIAQLKRFIFHSNSEDKRKDNPKKPTNLNYVVGLACRYLMTP